MLRIFTGVVLEVVTFVLIGVDVVFRRTFSGSDSECFKFWTDIGFLTTGAISFSISFWFSARILVRSDVISFLRNVLILSSFSDWIFGVLLGRATQFSTSLLSEVEASNSHKANSVIVFFLASSNQFWLKRDLLKL